MKITILICIFPISITIYSQTYWEVFEDSNYYTTSVEELETDDAGNIYAAGTQPVELYPTLNFIDKKDPEGNLLWKVDIEKAIYSYIVSPEGISYVFFYTIDEIPAIDEFTYYVRAYDTNGNPMWQKNVSDTSRTYNEANEEAMAVDKDGNVIIGIQAYNIAPVIFSVIDETFNISKLDGETGNLLAQTSLSFPDIEQTPMLFIRTDAKSNVYMFFDTHPVMSNTLYKFDKLLNLKWQKDYGSYEPNKIITDRDKAIYLVKGVFSGSAWDYVESLKINAANGDTIFNSQILTPEYLGTSSDLYVDDVTLDKKHNLVIIYSHIWSGGLDPNILLKIRSKNGTTLFLTELISSTGGYFKYYNVRTNILNEIFVSGIVTTTQKPATMKYTKAGTKIWEHIVTTDKQKLMLSDVYTPLNNFVLGGRETVLITTARYTVSFDCNLAERQPSPSTYTETKNDFLIYPNPASYIIQLKSAAEEIEYINTYTTAGAKVPLVFNEHLQADVSHLPSGIYITEIITVSGKTAEKWVKE